MSAPSIPASDVGVKRPPSLGGINLTVLGLEIRRLLRNRRTVIFALVIPAVFFLLFGLNKAYAYRAGGPWQCLGVHHGQHGALRRGPGHHLGRSDGLHRASRRVEPPAPAHSVVADGLHRHQDADRHGAGRGGRHRRLRRRQDLRRACHAARLRLAVVRDPAVRVGRLARLRRVRAVHGLPAADRECHAVPRASRLCCSPSAAGCSSR